MKNNLTITLGILAIACTVFPAIADDTKQKPASISKEDLTVKINKVHGKTTRKEKGKNQKIYTYPTGYEISIKNNRKEPIGNIVANYTIYYSTQELKGEERINRKQNGKIKCPDLDKWNEETVKTKFIELRKGRGSSSKKGKKSAKNTTYGKDIMIGCTVDIYVDGKHVMTENSGMLKIPENIQPIEGDGAGKKKKGKKKKGKNKAAK